MKLLHIGKKGNIENHMPDTEFARSLDIVDLPMDTPVEEMLRLASDADFVIADAIASIPAELICGMPDLKLIHSEGVGYNAFDIKAARAHGVDVCNCKGMNATAVAEQTVLLMLGVLRDVRGGDIAVREGRQITKKENYMVEGNLLELSDCTVGLIGLGDIGKAVARLMQAFGVRTFYYSRTRKSPEEEADYGVSYLPLDTLLASCDMISLHLPVFPETMNMADDAFFAKMRDGSYLINTGRGELVDSAALVRAIRSGKLAMAGLDTVAGEPVQADNILLTQEKEVEDRILFSPHIGGVTASSCRRGYATIWENLARVAKGERPVNVVN